MSMMQRRRHLTEKLTFLKHRLTDKFPGGRILQDNSVLSDRIHVNRKRIIVAFNCGRNLRHLPIKLNTVLVYNYMKRTKTDNSPAKIHPLQIKIPNLTHSDQKLPPNPTSNTPRYNTVTLKPNFYKKINYAVFTAAKNYNSSRHKVVRAKTDSKSPKNKPSSPKKISQNTINPKQIFQDNLATTRSIDDVKKKLQGYHTPSRLPNKFFKKQTPVALKLEDMNKTLKKMAENKTSKPPKYELKMIRKVGKSQTGDILLAISNVNSMLVAIKTFRKDKIKLEYLIDQIKIHLYCQHPHILPAYGFHIGKDQVYLVMEYGYHNLYEQILQSGPFNEKKTAKYITQVVQGIEYLHRHGIIHRDLKPENVICLGQHLKIADFGWSIKTDRLRKTLCGTLDYISPEVAERSYYDNKIDCWSIGVLIYEMLVGSPPFQQKAQQYEFSSFIIPIQLSAECRDLLTKLLEVNPMLRLSAKQILQHSWIKNSRANEILTNKKKYRQMQKQIQKIFA